MSSMASIRPASIHSSRLRLSVVAEHDPSVIRFSLGQQGTELLPDGLDDVWLDRGHGQTPSHREASITPRMIGYTVSALQISANRRTASLLAQALIHYGPFLLGERAEQKQRVVFVKLLKGLRRAYRC